MSKKFKEVVEMMRGFELPNLPSGRTVTVELFSNWGDCNHVGLNGIEFFDESGRVLKFLTPEDSIWMQSTGRRKKPSIYNDPSFLARIIGGKFLTRDQNDIWITNYEQGSHLAFCLNFEELQTLSMIRVWNYNKSRIHSTRGVRHVVIRLDEQIIFFGEIKRASGGDFQDLDKLSEYVLFTERESILEAIEKNDWVGQNTADQKFFSYGGNSQFASSGR